MLDLVMRRFIFALLTTVFGFRELAFQISEHFQALGKPMGLKVCVVTGGRGECVQC